MMKRSHIENIRKAVKNVGDYKPTAEQIRAGILKVCPDEENVNENKQEIVEEVIKLIESSCAIAVAESEASDNLIDSISQPQISDMYGIESSELDETALTVNQKRDLVAAEASQLKITLSESEIVEVSESINNQINSRSEFIAEIRSAIHSFIDAKADSQKQEINDFVEETIDYAASKFRDNDQRLREGLQEINNFFRSDSARFKELSKTIATAFKI
jgi:predicted HicB family RNase H-like nuclease